MSGYPEFSLVARRRLLPAGGTRLERAEVGGGVAAEAGGTRRCALATLLSNLLSSTTFPPLVLAFHQPFPRQLPGRVPLSSICTAQSKYHFYEVPALRWSAGAGPINHCTKYSRPGWQLAPRSARP